MPKKQTIERAKQDKREGKSASTQAGEFVKETIDEMRKGKHGARSTRQAIAIGLSKARRAGVDLPPPKKGKTSERTRKNAQRAYRQGQSGAKHQVNPRRSRAVTRALQRESAEPASSEALSRHASQQSRKRTAHERSQSAKKGARTRLAHQSHAQRVQIARKAAKTRAERQAG